MTNASSSASALALILALHSNAPSAQETAPLQRLFVPLETGPAASDPDGSVTVRERTVGARVELLADGAQRSGSPRIELNLFPDLALAFVLERAEPAWGGGWIASGRIEEDRWGSATFSVVDGVVAGTVRAHGGLYRVRYAGGGVHVVAQLDEERFPVCGNGPEQELAPVSGSGTGGAGAAQEAARSAGGAQPLSMGGATVDVLVVYTTKAKNAQGGTASMQALVNLAIAETNQAYLQSQVGQRLRLVHQAELAGYTENGSFTTELSRLTNPGDGWIDDVHVWRDQHGADEVSMIIDSTQYCGIAWLMNPVSGSFATNAFNVVSRTCTTGYYSFGHELGHNMACHHDHGNAGSAAYPYAYGYRTPSGKWRTILAYAPGTRIPYFSNPNVSYQGEALGIPEPQPLPSENWKTLNNTAPVVSQWRCAIPEPYGAGKLTSSGSQPSLGWTGSPKLSGGPFTVDIASAEPGKPALVFYGFMAGQTPFLGGTLYVSGTVVRLPVQTLDGSGAAQFPFPLAGFVAGDELYAQGWFRDPAHPDGTGAGLTNGLRIDVCP
jgi:hypothetical protein